MKSAGADPSCVLTVLVRVTLILAAFIEPLVASATEPGGPTSRPAGDVEPSLSAWQPEVAVGQPPLRWRDAVCPPDAGD